MGEMGVEMRKFSKKASFIKRAYVTLANVNLPTGRPLVLPLFLAQLTD